MSVLDFSFARRTPLLLQTEAAECGLACLAMVAGFHGHRIDMATLRARHSISLKGSSLIFFLSLSFVLFTLFNLSLYFCSVSIKCLSLLGNVRCELVIYFRKLFCSDCMYCAFEYSFFTLQIF